MKTKDKMPTIRHGLMYIATQVKIAKADMKHGSKAWYHLDLAEGRLSGLAMFALTPWAEGEADAAIEQAEDSILPENYYRH